MATLYELVEEVLLNLESGTGDVAIYGTLPSTLTSSATSFTVTGPVYPDGSGFSTGILEIGDELVYAQNLNRSTGAYTGVMRGWRGTTPATHPAGTLVRSNPTWARAQVKRAINDTIINLPGTVFGVGTHEFVKQGSVVKYTLPDDADRVLAVHYLPSGSYATWTTVKQWKALPTSTASTPMTIDVYDAAPGRTVRVTYAKRPAELTSNSSVFSTVTGLPDWCRDLVVYGACWRLASTVDASMLGGTSAEQASNLGRQQNMSGTNVSKYFLGMYGQRLQEVEARMGTDFPAVRHWVG